MRESLDIGITCNLKRDVQARDGDAPDAHVEYDDERTLDAVRDALERAGHRARYLGYGEAMLDAIRARRPDLVFNFAEGIGGRNRATHVPATLEMLGIPYTHADPLCLAVSQDKAVAKRLVGSFGVRTPRFAVVDDVAQVSELSLTFPVFAKPVGEGSSMGIQDDARVESLEALRALVRRLLSLYREPVLVEEFCPGLEFSVGLLGTGRTARVLGTSSITPVAVSVDRFVYSRAVKALADWSSHMTVECPPRCAPSVRADVERVALEAYRALECRDVGRVDVRLDAEGRASFIELNPLPGISPGYSDLTLIAHGMGVTYPALITAIVDEARSRYPGL
jgi:D-alanine-D-alanine ligase